MKKVFNIIIFLHLSLISLAQVIKEYPVPGQPCPYFEFNNIYGRTGEKITLDDLIGEPFILDFWGIGCATCIKSFPKLNEWNEKYGNLKIILVGYDKFNIQNVYKKYQESLGLTLISAFDTEVKEQFKIELFPTYVWVDSEGIVKAVTDPLYLNEENITRFLTGESFDYNPITEKDYSLYNREKPLGFEGNGGMVDTSFMFRSLLYEWKTGMGSFTGRIHEPYLNANSAKVDILKTRIKYLYRQAYISIQDAEKYISDIIMDDSNPNFLTSTKLYCYSVTVPKSKSTPSIMMRIMQNDLSSYFGYRARTIDTNVNRYYLYDPYGMAKEKLKSKATAFDNIESSDMAINANGMTFKSFLSSLNSKFSPELRIINKTEIEDEFLIDVNFRTPILHHESVISELKNLGFVIEIKPSRMKALIITDDF